MNRKKLLVLLVAALIIFSGLALVSVLFWGRTEERSDRRTASMNQQGKGSKVNWNQINSIAKCDFSLNAEGDSANRPVRGQLVVRISPAQLQHFPETLDVYRIVPLVESDKQFRDLANRFGLRGEFSIGSVGVKAGTRSLTYDPNLDQLVYIDDNATKYPTHIPNVPSVSRCKQIAMNIASEKGLLPTGARVVATSEETGTISHLTGNEEHLISRTVVVAQDFKISGYQVRGTGMQMRLTLGDGGVLCYLIDSLRPLKVYGTYPLKPIDQALAEAQAGKDTVNLQANIENPTVNAVDIFYYCDTSDRTHGLLMPVYAFMSDNCCIYVPAVNEK
jgi:hypothetical protein